MADLVHTDLQTLLRRAQDFGRAWTRAEQDFTGDIDGTASIIAHGAKFFTGLHSLEKHGKHQADAARALAEELAHYILTGETRMDRLIAAAHRVAAGVGHA